MWLKIIPLCYSHASHQVSEIYNLTEQIGQIKLILWLMSQLNLIQLDQGYIQSIILKKYSDFL